LSDIAFVQPIFAPDEMRFKRNMDSLHSMAEYLEKNPYKLNIFLGGWAKDEYWKQLRDYAMEHLKPTKIQRFEKNFGKAIVVNTLTKNLTDEKYMLTADSDILFRLEEEHMFDRLINCAEILPELRKKPFGLLSLAQMGQDCHWENAKKNEMKYQNKYGKEEFISFPCKGSSGIAGGCLFLNIKMWKNVNGYREMGVYAGDDAYLMVDALTSKHTIQIFKSLSIVHPYENDPVYMKWKSQTVKKSSIAGRQKNDKEKRQYIKDAENFWKTHEEKQ
jgi:hypothetical protein